jgi:N-methylhydantoinase A/oxoprolinase/acetone carboxylase beta subunit
VPGAPEHPARHRGRLGIDTGGTFTDLVTATGAVVKVPSTPSDPGAAVRDAIAGTGDGAVDVLAHGTTVATNALLERRGARVALVATAGFADEIEIARQARPALYDPFVDRPEPLVARRDRHEVRGRLQADGRELEPLALDDVDALGFDPGVDAVAVCLLHSDREAAHERAVADRLRARGLDVSCSHEVSPEYREYERMVTTVANAYLRPRCRPYLTALAGLAADPLVMTSAGGLVPVDGSALLPVSLLLSGPAAGARAAAAIAAACGFPDAVSFDMGGTSTDVCLIAGGAPEPAAQRTVAGLPVRMPALDIHTIGAGGGSIATIDRGGALRVGPRSAGALPGPACYGRGGTDPTVTDADLLLGRIPAAHPFPGLGVLDVDAARAACARAGVEPNGVVEVVDAAMQQAVRAVTVERGVDPADLALVAFGGAGPLHACAIAAGLGMSTVIVPPRAGVFSAVGLLCAPRRHEVVRSVGRGGVDGARRDALDAARALGGPDAALSTMFDCRYAGQSHEITVVSVDGFEAEHERRNGFRRDGVTIEVVAVRAAAALDAPMQIADLPPAVRAAASGACVVAEADCTVFVPAGWRADVGPLGAWLLTRERS